MPARISEGQGQKPEASAELEDSGGVQAVRTLYPKRKTVNNAISVPHLGSG